MVDTVTISITTPDLRSMSQPAAAMDPDISATLSDFLTYTEHLPSAVVRSMTLIETLNRKAAQLQKQIHDLLTTYSILPTLAGVDAPDPVGVREDISRAYERLDECKRMSAAEAARIEDMVTRDARRLHLVSQKLHALPMPPSRDPTPEPILSSPQLKRTHPLSQAQQSADKRVAAHRTTTAPRVRNRDRIMVPGEVLPPPNPDSPPASEPDDWPSPPPQSPHEQRRRQKSIARQKTPKPPRPPKTPGEKVQKTPRQRPPGTPGTNAHSAVAGISTSNAIMALTRPPADAKPGSKWLPWMRLTEFELAILRKRMKKNAAWRPSPAMRNRELKDLGRGLQAMEEAKAEAEQSGIPFLDEFDQDSWLDPTQTAISGEQAAEMNAMLGPEKEQPEGDEALINRGMRLNEAKKLKRERQKAEELSQFPTELPEQQKKDPARDQKRPDEKRDRKDDRRNHQKRDRKDIQESPAQPEPERPRVLQDEQRLAGPEQSAAKKSARQADANKAAKLSGDTIQQPNTPRPPPPPATDNTAKKRKREATPNLAPKPGGTNVESPDVLSLTRSGPEKKKLRIHPPAPPPADTIPTTLSPNAATSAAPSPRITTRPRSQRPSIAPEQPLPPNTRSAKPTITIKRPKAASAEPSARRSTRRGSVASLPGAGNKIQSPPLKTTPGPAEGPAAARPRRKRPPPGGVVAAGDGSATIIIDKRKKPSKKQIPPVRGGSTTKKEGTPAVAAEDEVAVDPNEPRYCICSDVSWGTMIACDNAYCEKEWFHLECVKLQDMPPRRAKWYCPDCRKKLKLGQNTNGIVTRR